MGNVEGVNSQQRAARVNVALWANREENFVGN
jgi:hypothetical protein